MKLEASLRLRADLVQDDFYDLRNASWVRHKDVPPNKRQGGGATVGHIAWPELSAGMAFGLPSRADVAEFGRSVYRCTDPTVRMNCRIFKIDLKRRLVLFLDNARYLEGEVEWGSSANISRIVILESDVTSNRLMSSREDPSGSPLTYNNLLTDSEPEETPEIQLLTRDDGTTETADGDQALSNDTLPINHLLNPI